MVSQRQRWVDVQTKQRKGGNRVNSASRCAKQWEICMASELRPSTAYYPDPAVMWPLHSWRSSNTANFTHYNLSACRTCPSDPCIIVLRCAVVKLANCLNRSSKLSVLNYIEEHSIEVHNSSRPLDRLTAYTLTLTFDLIFIGGRDIAMDYLCAKFGDFSFSRFGF